jgi:hypothetical protein
MVFRRENLIKTSSKLKQYCPSFQLIVSIIVICIFFSSTAHTKETVSGRYVSITKNQIEFIVNVGIPAPTSLIVQHFHPAQILLGTVPQASKVDSDMGSVKWFIKSVEPGEIPFTLTFNRNLSESSVKVILRYRDPVTGNYTESIFFP